MLPVCGGRLPLVRMDDGGPSAAFAVGKSVAGEFVPAPVVEIDEAVRTGRPDHLRHRVEDRAPALLGRDRRLLGAAPLGKIGEGDREAVPDAARDRPQIDVEPLVPVGELPAPGRPGLDDAHIGVEQALVAVARHLLTGGAAR
jgi:hypothetical protein